MAWIAGVWVYEWLLVAALPPALARAFDLVPGRQSLAAFMANELFSVLWILALAYGAVSEAVFLVAGLEERDLVSFLLALSRSRRRLMGTRPWWS